MTYTTTNAEFDRVFGRKSLTVQFLQKIRVYLSGYKDQSPYKELYEGIVNREPIAVFSCPLKNGDDVLMRLLENAVPCLMVVTKKGRAGFIHLAKDTSNVVRLQNELLSDLQNFMKLKTGKGMWETMPKGCSCVVSLKGLSTEEVYLMKKLCRSTVKLSALGVDRMKDGTFRLSFYGNEIMKRGRDGLTIAQAYALSKMMMHGRFKEEIAERARRQETLETVIAERFDVNELADSDSITLVGDGNAYVRLSKDGFESGYIKNSDGEYIYVPSENGRFRVEDPMYLGAVRSGVMHLSNPVAVADINDLGEVMNNSSAMRSTEEITEDVMERRILSAASNIIMESKTAPVMERAGDEEKKLKYMIRESAELIKSGSTGVFSAEYTEDQIRPLKEELRNTSLDLNSLAAAITILAHTETELDMHKENVITDLDAFVKDYELPEIDRIRKEISRSK